MATIQYNGYAPSDYSDIGPGGVQSGPDIWDDVIPTTVTASARIMNTGNANGTAELRIVDVGRGDFGETVGSSGRQTVRAGAGLDPSEGGASEPVILTARYKVPNHARVSLSVEVYSAGRGDPIESRQFTVNSYEVPQVANLTSGTIDISVA